MSTAARNVFWQRTEVRDRKSRNRLAFPSAGSDSQNSCTARLTVTHCNIPVHQKARATPGSATAARNGYLTEVQATTKTARVSERVARFAKFLHRTTRCNFLIHQTARATSASTTAARNGYLTEVQATTETARVSERNARFAKFLHRTTRRDPLQLSNSPDSARHARFDHGGAQRLFDRNPGHHGNGSRFRTRRPIRKILAPHDSP